MENGATVERPICQSEGSSLGSPGVLSSPAEEDEGGERMGGRVMATTVDREPRRKPEVILGRGPVVSRESD